MNYPGYIGMFLYLPTPMSLLLITSRIKNNGQKIIYFLDGIFLAILAQLLCLLIYFNPLFDK